MFQQFAIYSFYHLEYYLEDVIQMLGFVPPLKDKKKRGKDVDVDLEEEVNVIYFMQFVTRILMFDHLTCICNELAATE